MKFYHTSGVFFRLQAPDTGGVAQMLTLPTG